MAGSSSANVKRRWDDDVVFRNMARDEPAEKKRFINDTIRLSSFSTQFIQSLATLAANTGDQAIRDVLAKHGVTFEVQPPAASEATAEESKP